MHRQADKNTGTRSTDKQQRKHQKLDDRNKAGLTAPSPKLTQAIKVAHTLFLVLPTLFTEPSRAQYVMPFTHITKP